MEHIEKSKYKFTLTTPLAILLGAILVSLGLGLGIYFGFRTLTTQNNQFAQEQQEPTYNLEAMNPVTSEDHIRGNTNAKIKIVEYSDTECPFCKRFHDTMTELMKEYGDNGDVAWVYRHMPLPQLHQKAQKEAEANECAAELGGNDKFWEYMDRLMEVTPSNDGLDSKELVNIAKFVGLNAISFNECLNSGRMASKVNAHAENGAETGGNGTPWSIVVGPNKKLPLSGAMPIEVVKTMIEEAGK